MQSLEYIDGYFRGEFSQKEKIEFERKLNEDPDFADDVAFYISTRQISKDLVTEEKKNNFKKIYAEYDKEAKVIPMRRIWSYSAAAAVFVVLIFGWFMFMKPPTAQQLADHYIKTHLSRIEPTMGGSEDSLQTAIRLYNQGNFEAGLKVLEGLMSSHPNESKAVEYAGVFSIRAGKLDQAIQYFSRLESLPLAYNPGAFYHALALMKRNGPGDSLEAKKYLEKVINEGLEHKEDVPELLKRL